MQYDKHQDLPPPGYVVLTLFFCVLLISSSTSAIFSRIPILTRLLDQMIVINSMYAPYLISKKSELNSTPVHRNLTAFADCDKSNTRGSCKSLWLR